MGAVLLAEEPSLSRKVALKVMRPELAANPSARERFFREAKSAAAIEHDHIIPIFAVSEANGVPFLAMPFLKGQPLDERLKSAQGPLPLAEIAHIGREIASGLAAAHEQGLIHRDIKPGNIWLEDRGPDSPARVKILDFGLARSQAEDAHLTQSGAILGTPAYMAPEQALGHKVDERADLFSLGCVLYQMATGRRPFTGETTMAVLMSLGIDAPTAPQELNPRIPQTLSQLIMGLLVKDPAKRLASAAEVARKLRAIEMDLTPLVVPMAESVPVPTTSDPWSGIDDGETPSRAPTIAPQQTNLSPGREPPAKRKGLLYGIIGLLALAAGGFIIIKITNKDGTVTEVKVPDTAKIEVDGKTIVALNPDAKNNEPLPPTFTNSIGMEFVKVPKGTGWLGGGGGKQGETKVMFDQDFYLGKYEVTQEEWEAVTGQNPSQFSRKGEKKDAVKDISDADLKQFPVDNVSWEDCQLFIERLNKKEKDTGWVYRLPKEAEWEYACRRGPVDKLDSGFDFYFAKPTNKLLPEQANFNFPKALKRTCKAGSYEPNPLGLYDMHGNAWEWCVDDDNGPNGVSHRVLRGGHWFGDSGGCRAAFRGTNPPSYRDSALGLRIARVSVARKDATPTEVANLPPLKPIDFKPIPIGESPFDKLDPKEIPAAERFEWQPKELVGLIGSHARRHWFDVRAIAFSPDGKLAATGSAGLDYIIIWDLATQTAKHRLQWTRGSWLSNVDSLQFSEDGKKLYAGMHGNGSGLRVIDLSGPEPKWLSMIIDGKETTEWFNNRTGSIMAAFENGNTLAVFGHAVSLFDWNNGSPKLVTDKFPVTGFPVFVPKTNQMIFASPEGKLKRATIKNAKFVDDAEIPVPLEPKEYPRAVRVDGKVLALWVKDRIELWDVSGDKPAKKCEWKQSDAIRADSRFSISPDGRWFTGSYNEPQLWRVDGNEPKLVALLDQSWNGLSQVGFSSDGNRVIVGNLRGFVRFWDLSGAEPKELAPFDPATAFLPNRGGNTFDSARGYLMLPHYDSQPGKWYRNQLWDLTGKRPEPAPNAGSFLDPDGTIHFAGANRWLQIPPQFQQRPRLYTLADGRWQSDGPEFGEPNTTGNVSEDGRLMVAYAGPNKTPDRLEGWDLSANPPAKKWSQSLKDHPVFEHWGYRQVWFSADGRWFATTAKADKADGPWKLVVWRNTGAKPEVYTALPCTWQPHLYVAAFSPDGRYLAHTPEANHTVSIMDLSGPKPREARRIEGNLSGLGYVQTLAFHPDGKHLAYGSHISAGVLDVTTGHPVWEWNPPGPVDRLDWAADGRHLVTHNGNKTIYVLRLNKLIQKLTAKEVREPVGDGLVDLLDLNEDWTNTLAGKGWEKKDGKWTSTFIHRGWSVLGLPLATVGSYDLEAEVTFDKGDDSFWFHLPIGERAVSFGFNRDAIAGLRLINGQYENKNPTQTMHDPLKIGQRVKVRISVRLKGDQAEIIATVDGIPPIKWSGPIADLSREDKVWSFPQDRIGVGSWSSQYTLHTLRFKKIDGKAEIIKRVPLAKVDKQP